MIFYTNYLLRVCFFLYRLTRLHFVLKKTGFNRIIIKYWSFEYFKSLSYFLDLIFLKLEKNLTSFKFNINIFLKTKKRKDFYIQSKIK